LVKRALAGIAVGEEIVVHGQAPDFAVHLEAWARSEGHRVRASGGSRSLTCSAGRLSPDAGTGPNVLATRIRGKPEGVVEKPPRRWGLAARGANVEAGRRSLFPVG
jgi:hypothetical protein